LALLAPPELLRRDARLVGALPLRRPRAARGRVRSRHRPRLHHAAPALREWDPAARAQRGREVRRRPRVPGIQATDEHPRPTPATGLGAERPLLEAVVRDEPLRSAPVSPELGAREEGERASRGFAG